MTVGNVLGQSKEVQFWLPRSLIGLDQNLADGGVFAD